VRIKQALQDIFEDSPLAYTAARGNTKRVAQLLSALPQKTIIENMATQVQAQPQSPQAQAACSVAPEVIASYAILPPTIPPQPFININHH
jgi:hypothetical protein